MLIGAKGLEGFEDTYKKRNHFKISDFEINFISYQDFITNKKAVGREKDLPDIEQLQKLGRNG